MDKEKLLYYKKIFDNSFYPYYFDIETMSPKINTYIPKVLYFDNVKRAEEVTKIAREMLKKYGKRALEFD